MTKYDNKGARQIKYTFEYTDTCEMCGDKTDSHRVLGQRLNQSQGLTPKKKSGISVSVKKCNQCELIYAFPLPIPFDIQDHYGVPPEDYWTPEYFKWTPEYYAEIIEEVKKLSPVKKGMMALDIGAGLGKAMLSLNNAGFDTFGTEPSVPFFERAISKMNISADRLKLGMIEDVDFSPSSFDFITYGAVFEHLYHPAKTLARAKEWLKPNGIIHIEVPSSKHFIPRLLNLYYRLMGTSYVTNISPMHSPFHIYEFGLKSFESLAQKMGLKVEHYTYAVCEIAFVPRIFHPIFRKYMELTNTGMQLTVYLRKI